MLERRAIEQAHRLRMREQPSGLATSSSVSPDRAMNDPEDRALPAPPADELLLPDGGATHKRESLLKLSAGSIGVVFGDIGTSPLYAFRAASTGRRSRVRRADISAWSR